MNRPKIILDYGVNHEGDIEKALTAIEMAACVGVDAIKFQHYDPKELEKPDNYCLTFKEYMQIAKKCQSLNLKWGISLFDSTWEHVLYFLNFGVSFFKISTKQAEKRVIDIHLTKLMNKIPDDMNIIISLSPMHLQGNLHKCDFKREKIDFLVCIPEYPCYEPPLDSIAKNPGVGYSCHIPMYHACLAAQMLGAPVIEKHFTLEHDQSDFRDHRHALDYRELKAWLYWVDYYANAEKIGKYVTKMSSFFEN